MKNMDKGLTVPKWLLIILPKILQMPQSLSAQFVCPSPKVQDFNEKRLHWASVVRECYTTTTSNVTTAAWLLLLCKGLTKLEIQPFDLSETRVVNLNILNTFHD